MPKKFKYFIIGFIIVIPSFTFWIYSWFTSPNILIFDGDAPIEYQVKEGTDFPTLLDDLVDRKIVKHGLSLAFVAKVMGYQENIKPGWVLLEPKMNNMETVRALRLPYLKEVTLTFNNVRFIEDIPVKLCANIDASAAVFEQLLSDSLLLKEHGFTKETILCMFIPNTYKVFKETTAEELFLRMKKEYVDFWEGERRRKADSLGLSPEEVITLASIVNEETKVRVERPKVASVYLNRLQNPQLFPKLEADPTLRFAAKAYDRPPLNKDKKIDSPYNTYKYAGLPPGPICMPDVSSIDAVLSPGNHSYFFFVAKGDCSGTHNFSETNRQHNKFVKLYRKRVKLPCEDD